MYYFKHLNPIFIGGCPRSGTTFLGDLLGAASESIVVPESQFKTQEYNEIYNDKNLKKTIKNINNNYRFKVWNIELSEDEIQSLNIKSYNNLIKYIVSKYAKQYSNRDKNLKYWIDHTPGNFKDIKLLAELFPDAKYIHLVRDGRAVTNSIIPLFWGPNSIIGGAKWWRKHLNYALEAESFFDESQILRIKYEDLITKTEIIINEICDFANLEYSKEMIQGGNFKKPGYTRHQHNLVGKSPDISRLYAWEKNLTQRDIELFEYFASDYLILFNYKLKFNSPSKANMYEIIKFKFKEKYRKYINRVMKKWRIHKNT